MKKSFIYALLVSFPLFMLISCATYRPIIDMKGVDNAQYAQDLWDCEKYAEQLSPATEAAVGAVGGAAVGAALGAIVGAFFGCPGETAGFGAAIGGASGALGGAGHGIEGQQAIIQRCMEGRGYTVLR